MFATNNKFKKKYYCLDMFPYPSGSGLHVGHPVGYVATDIISRYKRMKGYAVLHPMGWDAFGLPAENFAIKTGTHPNKTTKNNIATFKKQLNSIGLSYDWKKEINTTNPKYYKWTQWIFLKFFNSYFDEKENKAKPISLLLDQLNRDDDFKKLSEKEKSKILDENRLAYEKEMPVNWCSKCKVVVANEEVINGNHERCGTKITKKNIKQWNLRITKYAKRLLDDLELLPGWPEKIKLMQKNWIGQSTGAEVDFYTENRKDKISIYTTRLDTIFSATFVILSVEHPLLEKIVTDKRKQDFELYKIKTLQKSDLERTELNKEKTGVFTGSYVVNPANDERIPVWVSDFVLPHYGTGAVFADAHDERDFEMAKKFDIPLKVSIKPINIDDETWKKIENLELQFSGLGILVNSNQFNGLTSEKAKEEILSWLSEKKLARKKINYKMRDWIFSRQRYWGEPIPLIHCDNCGTLPLGEESLPLELPDVERYHPSDTGESPLANIEKWVNVSCHKCGRDAKRETNTMPQWAGSSWYYLRFMDNNNDDRFISKNNENFWQEVDLYVGGAEHAVLHLLYSRFWHKVLFDLGLVSKREPFKKLINQGLILAEDKQKMSKSLGNVINPDDIIKEYGADTLRVYEMFMGQFDQNKIWSTSSIKGIYKFLQKLYSFFSSVSIGEENNKDVLKITHQTIKKVTIDIEEFKFNTAISQMMIWLNKVSEFDSIDKDLAKMFVKLLSPFAPHLAEEIWIKFLHENSILTFSKWPEHNEELIIENDIKIAVQINGKLRSTINVKNNATEKEVFDDCKEIVNVRKYIEGKKIVKIIFVKNRVINIIVG